MAKAHGGQEESQYRLDEVLVGYLRACDSGRRPDRDALLAKYPELAPELTEYFQVEDAIQGLLDADRLSGSSFHAAGSRDSGSTIVLEGSTRQSSTPAATAGPFAPQGDEALGRFGDYVLAEELGRGRLGAVYRAMKRGTKRASALKLILASYEATPEELERFRSQMKAAAALGHPGFVHVETVGERLGLHYVVMSLVRGGDLASQIPRFQNDPPAAARLVAAVARALHDAHEAGMVHGHISPSNILPNADDSPLIADLGMAALPVRPSDASPYLAPEHLESPPGRLTRATDVYGLGVLLYVLLSGEAPFRGRSDGELRKRIVRQKPRNPVSSRLARDRALSLVCLKCLQKAPRDRYASCLEVAEELNRWLSGQPMHTKPRPGFWGRRHRNG